MSGLQPSASMPFRNPGLRPGLGCGRAVGAKRGLSETRVAIWDYGRAVGAKRQLSDTWVTA
jgi:hypothetical protein